MLIDIIKMEISKHPKQRIPFSRFMELCLYHPTWGYYSSQKQKIGKNGDFYTNSSVNSIYGEIWGDAFIRTWEELGLTNHSTPLVLLEVGGGTGRFARFVLEYIQHRYPDHYKQLQYMMLEQSRYHQFMQKKELSLYRDHVKWLDTLADVKKLPQEGKPTILYSNELFDALPVERIQKRKDGIYECWIEIREHHLAERWVPMEREELQEYLSEMNLELPVDHQLEIPLASKALFTNLMEILDHGVAFTVDYGWTTEELLAPHRSEGTLIGYVQHQHVTDFFQHPGETDITAHVHFDALIKWGRACGVQHESYLTQREWLFSQGILNKLQEHQDPNPFGEIAKRNRSILQLIAPGGMGDTFKVLTQRK